MASSSVCLAAPGRRPPEHERSLSDDDLLIVPPEEGSRHFGLRRGRPPRSIELLHSGERLNFAVLVGQSGGRWWPELHGQAKACRDALARLTRAQGCGAGEQPPTDGAIVGVAVVRAWRCVRHAASHQDTYALMQASAAHHQKRRGELYLEHEVIASAGVGVSDHSVLADSAKIASLPCALLGQRLLQRLSAASALVTVSKGDSVGATMAIDELMSVWASTYAIQKSAVVAWPAAFPLALAMAAGVWYGDVSVKHQRKLPTEVTMAPLAPPDALFRHWLRAQHDRPKPPENDGAEGHPIWDARRRGCVLRYHPQHIIAALRAGQHVHNKARVAERLRNAARFLYPRGRAS